jgi:amidophosphoribosyltransferase
MCGIFGVFSVKPMRLVPAIHEGLLLLNHRGQEGTGAIFTDRKQPLNTYYERRIAKTNSSVQHFFSKFDHTDKLFYSGMGQNRYSTAGSIEKIENLQPMYANTRYGKVAVVHNGNLPYAEEMRDKFQHDGEMFMSDSDTEVILTLISHSQQADLIDAIIESLRHVRGSYSLIFLTESQMIVARDPYGYRPLSIAEFDNGYMFSSETCSFKAASKEHGVKFLRDVDPGEIIVVSDKGLESIKPFEIQPLQQCIFELIYFARPDSKIFGRNCAQFRMALGKLHSKEHPIRVDQICAIPDSANYFGDGHAAGLSVPHIRALVRNHYSSRTFINPDQEVRAKNIRLKINPIEEMLVGLDSSVDDDSIVRGNTSRKIVRMIRGCGPRSITMSVSCPPIISHCPYGIDIKGKKELIFAQEGSEEKVCRRIEADDLHYLSLGGLKSLGGPDFCYACFDEKYAL